MTGSVLRSASVPVTAIVLTALADFGNLAPPAPVDPTTGLRVGPGFTIRETDDAVKATLSPRSWP